MARAVPSVALTQEQFDRSKILKDIVANVRAGKSEWVTELVEGLDTQTLSPDTMAIVFDRLKSISLQFQVSHFTPQAALCLWRIATPDEKCQLFPIMLGQSLALENALAR